MNKPTTSIIEDIAEIKRLSENLLKHVDAYLDFMEEPRDETEESLDEIASRENHFIDSQERR